MTNGSRLDRGDARSRGVGAWTLLPSLTCRLLFASSDTWRQLSDADTDAHLPSPALHGAALGGVSAVLAAALWSLRPGLDFGSTVRCIVAAVSCGVGATALALAVVPALLSRQRSTSSLCPARASRYASVVALPLSASGFVAALPSMTAAFIALALLSALAYRSGSLGARVFLDLHGFERARVATSTCLVATLPSLVAASLHAVG